MRVPISSRDPQRIGLWSAVIATLAGVAYLALADAPSHMAIVNLAAIVVGFGILLSARLFAQARRFTHSIMLLIAIVLLATAVAGEAPEGAARWVVIGPLSIQPSLVLLPCLILLFARDRNSVSTLAIVITAVAMALQPDRAMAGVLLVALGTVSALRFDRFALVALVASLTGFAVTLFRPDTLPAVPFVDQIYYTAFDVHWLAAVFVISGSAVLLFPALAFVWLRDLDRDLCLVFGATWLAIILAAALGNYPTPVVGYSGAAIVGYVLSIACLPRAASSLRADQLSRSPG